VNNIGKKENLAAIARQTLTILNNGYYINNRGTRIPIDRMLDSSVSGTQHFCPSDFSEVLKKTNTRLTHRPSTIITQFFVKNETTLDAARRLIEENKLKHVVCLNFASAKHPGGGFLKGSHAQEESIALSSGLYASLSRITAYYIENRKNQSSFYTDHMIYSPEVPVFRDDSGNLLDRPYLLSVITAPAVNKGAVMKHEKQKCNKIEHIMKQRIEKILSLAVIYNHSVIILGAWGCGVFRNEPEDVAGYFYEQLCGTGHFVNAFARVVFAVFDTSSEQKTFKAFQKMFFTC
jgi:uncharacterized protein (TIGR02452 family)